MFILDYIIINALIKAGFRFIAQKNSYVEMARKGYESQSIRVPRGKISPKTAHRILNYAGVSKKILGGF